MKNLFEKYLAIALAALLLATPGMRLYANEPAGRNISVFRVDGEDG